MTREKSNLISTFCVHVKVIQCLSRVKIYKSHDKFIIFIHFIISIESFFKVTKILKIVNNNSLIKTSTISNKLSNRPLENKILSHYSIN